MGFVHMVEDQDFLSRPTTCLRRTSERAGVEFSMKPIKASKVLAIGALYVAVALAETRPAQADGSEKVNSKDGATMVFVPAGVFLMGSDHPPDQQFDKEKPAHRVFLDGYWIYKNDVTVAQYRAFCQATGRAMPLPPPWGWIDGHPMVSITWKDAAAYATWAGAALPTEAQWEKAARGDDGRLFPWGNQWDASKLWRSRRDIGDAGHTVGAGSFPAGASPYGCLDMEGNVWQWCADWYGPYRAGTSRNPTGPAGGATRAVRGGSWYLVDPASFRASNRSYGPPGVTYVFLGFRCVVAP